jgi:hypothetical protein
MPGLVAQSDSDIRVIRMTGRGAFRLAGGLSALCTQHLRARSGTKTMSAARSPLHAWPEVV